MNILFVTKSLSIGGVEIVTTTLANAFADRGHNVCIFSFFYSEENVEGLLSDKVSSYVGTGYKNDKETVGILRDIIIKHNINIIINQWGLPWLPIRVINKARKGMNVKVISVYHNQVDMNGRLMSCDKAISCCSNVILKSALRAKRWAVKFITSRSMRYVYNHSDIYEVLSPSFIEIFKNFTGIKNPDHLVAQTNPVTIVQTNDFVLDADKKQKEIIYVGRLDLIQKRVHRVIDTWNYLEEKFPNWRLTIVGDGEDRQNLENYVKTLGLKRVNFEGFQNPLEYYKRASMLLLTSDFEGFGLVIVEGMTYGVVPFVYGTYPAVFDIISDGKDGVILQQTESGYDAEAMSKKMSTLMEDPALLYGVYAKNAIEKAMNFSMQSIYNQWVDTISGGVILKPYSLSYTYKQKEIIYVGRLDLIQKRVHRVIDTWNYLEEQFPEWCLTIVGDGEDRQNLENHVKALGLQHVSFEGYKQPLEYYKRASLLLLTSDFEGFPLVLAECMSFGVIPAVYDSYAAVRDIIDDGEDGVIIPFNKQGYDADVAARLVADIMSDENKREKMSLNATEKSKTFSVERICDEWEKKLM